MKIKLLMASLIALAAVSSSFADVPIPTTDLAGARDDPLIGRFEGAVIVSYDRSSFDELSFPLSKLEEVEGKRDTHNNRWYAPKEALTLEGTRTRIVYLLPQGVSPLEVLRNYQQEITDKGGQILYECKEQECGGDPDRGSCGGGGGSMSLAMYLRPCEHIKDARDTPGYCAQSPHIAQWRYSVGALPDSEAHLSILAYSVPEWPGTCSTYLGRTVAILDMVEPKVRKQKMVTVKAEEMASQIGATGRIALYGIYFDFNKADLKPESQPTLDQIAQLLRDDPDLELLVVGHTDNVGSFPFNLDLSQRRADAVVEALVGRYGIEKARLSPKGVSYAAPVASNRTEAGRAKNRRVELVEN